MKFEPRTIYLKDGRICTLRPTDPEDAAQMIEYLYVTSSETPYLLRYADEIHYTLEQERELLLNALNDPTRAMMAAVIDGKIAGSSMIHSAAFGRKHSHRCSMAIALYKSSWGLGIGAHMIAYLTELAERMGYLQIELEVVEENIRARALYKKCGFVETGKIPRAQKFDDGGYHDEMLMVKILQ